MVGEEGGKGGETSGPCYAHRDTLCLLRCMRDCLL